MPALEHRILPGPDIDAASLAADRLLEAIETPQYLPTPGCWRRSACAQRGIWRRRPAARASRQSSRAQRQSRGSLAYPREAAATAEAAGDCEIARHEFELAVGILRISPCISHPRGNASLLSRRDRRSVLEAFRKTTRGSESAARPESVRSTENPGKVLLAARDLASQSGPGRRRKQGLKSWDPRWQIGGPMILAISFSKPAAFC